MKEPCRLLGKHAGVGPYLPVELGDCLKQVVVFSFQ